MAIPNDGSAFTTFDTYYTSDHDAPAWFSLDGQGGFYGETEGGIPFTQVIVFNEQAIRLQKFSIGSVFFYISDKGIIQAGNDLIAVSIYMSLT